MKPHFRIINQAVFFALLISGLVLFGAVLLPYIEPLFWALILAIVTYPLYLGILKLLRGYETTAALITTIIVVLCALIPIAFIATIAGEEAYSFYKDHTYSYASLQSIIHTYDDTLLSYGVNIDGLEERISSAISSASSWFSNQLVAFGKATLTTTLKTLLMLYMYFYFIRDGKRIMERIGFILPLGDVREKHLFETFVSITRALFKGTVFVAIAQGLLMALLLVFAGVSNIFLLSVVTIICAIIPAIGPAIVWIPVGLILLLTGDYMGAGIVLGGGVALISTIDNILRPVLVGRDTSLPDPIILISILGGIATFGIPGLIIGPISAGLALSLLTMFTDEYRTELENN